MLTINNNMTAKNNNILFWIGLITAIWFAFTGFVWAYWIALVFAYPFGLISLLIWMRIKAENKTRTKYIPIILTVGLTLSIISLVYLLIFD